MQPVLVVWHIDCVKNGEDVKHKQVISVKQEKFLTFNSSVNTLVSFTIIRCIFFFFGNQKHHESNSSKQMHMKPLFPSALCMMRHRSNHHLYVACFISYLKSSNMTEEEFGLEHSEREMQLVEKVREFLKDGCKMLQRSKGWSLFITVQSKL